MLDEELNPYLIEINTNPGLEISSPLISKLIPRMIDDTFRLTIDEVFGTIYSADRYGKDGYISPFHVDGYSDNENMFEFITNIKDKWYKVFHFIYSKCFCYFYYRMNYKYIKFIIFII